MINILQSCLLLILLATVFVSAQPRKGPAVLVVSAHPDDETTFPVTLYKITHHLNGVVDLFVITDGQGGFNGSELGSEYYGLNLTDSLTGRAHLPAIRKKELMNAGTIIGIRNYFFMDQPDDSFSLEPGPYLENKNWDTPLIEKRLTGVLRNGNYDFVFVLLPHEKQHAHHKAASILALRAVQGLNTGNKPIVMGGAELTKKDKLLFSSLKSHPQTEVWPTSPVYTFDRTTRFGYENQLSYQIVADWVYAEYKSQGGLQESEMHHDELEVFWYFAINGNEKLVRARQLFESVEKSGHPTGKAK